LNEVTDETQHLVGSEKYAAEKNELGWEPVAFDGSAHQKGEEQVADPEDQKGAETGRCAFPESADGTENKEGERQGVAWPRQRC
jgi:hypothetical protein